MTKRFLVIMMAVLLAWPVLAEENESKVEDIPSSELTPHDHGFYLGGSATLWYSQKDDAQTSNFELGLLPELGYHINQRFAVGAYIGYHGIFNHDEAYQFYGIIRPYGRVCVWHHGMAYLDLEARVGTQFDKEGLHSVDMGILPAIRLRVAPNVDMSAHFGFLGAEYLKDEGWSAGFMLSCDAMSIGLTYTFY